MNLQSAAQLARNLRVLLIRGLGGLGIDISPGALPFEELAAGRAVNHEFAPGIGLRVCAPGDPKEDPAILKEMARVRDLARRAWSLAACSRERPGQEFLE
ncbi:MAG: hypothetical protein FJW40_24875 [Acidobacteria bacterium]|nr:hypothetical protein [Acidobacteriota bacterium]